MRKVKDAVDLTTKEKIYFKGHAKATYLSDGRNMEDTMGGIAEAVMGIHENLSANYATKQYVQDALAEIPTAESSVFEAIYGETTFNEIVEQYNANKHVIVKYGEEFLSLMRITKNRIDFTSIVNNSSIRVTCDSNNAWNPYSYTLEWTRDKVKTISAESTDTQYPSAKAVYDFVNNTLGTIINGDY